MAALNLIFTTIWKKQLYFLIGTLILLLTWSLQNFIIDNNNETIDDIEKGINSFNNHLNNIRDDQAAYSNVVLINPNYSDQPRSGDELLK